MPVHRPWVGRKIGPEFEIRKFRSDNHSAQLSESTIRSAMTRVNNRVNPQPAGFYKSNGRTWDIKTDGSCGWEVAAPALLLDETGHNAEMETCLGALLSVNAMVDTACGTHVHLEVADYDWQDLRRLMILWARYEPFFFSLMPQNRRSNSYCSPIFRNSWTARPVPDWRQVDAASKATTRTAFEREARRISNRRLALNIGGFWVNNRIEIRLHSGTLHYTKIRKWAMLMSALVARPKMVNMPEIVPMNMTQNLTSLSTEYICKQLGLLPSRFLPASEIPQESIELAAWLDARRQQFAGRVTVPVVPPLPPPRTTHPVTGGYAGPVTQGDVVVVEAIVAPEGARQCQARFGIQSGRGHGRDQWGDAGNSCHNPAMEGRRGCVEHSADWDSGSVFRSIPMGEF